MWQFCPLRYTCSTLVPQAVARAPTLPRPHGAPLAQAPHGAPIICLANKGLCYFGSQRTNVSSEVSARYKYYDEMS